MAISKTMIHESRTDVILALVEHFNATPQELATFVGELEDEENWTCGFEDELVPLFLEVRSSIVKKELEMFLSSNKGKEPIGSMKRLKGWDLNESDSKYPSFEYRRDEHTGNT